MGKGKAKVNWWCQASQGKARGFEEHEYQFVETANYLEKEGRANRFTSQEVRRIGGNKPETSEHYSYTGGQRSGGLIYGRAHYH